MKAYLLTYVQIDENIIKKVKKKMLNSVKRCMIITIKRLKRQALLNIFAKLRNLNISEKQINIIINNFLKQAKDKKKVDNSAIK